MARFGASLTDSQFRFARLISDRLGVSISQAVKALERRDQARIDDWQRQLDAQREEGEC